MKTKIAFLILFLFGTVLFAGLRTMTPIKQASGPFTPASITGLKLWIDMQNSGSITQSLGLISQINDLSGNGNNLTQAIAANQFSYSATAFNSKPGAVRSGTPNTQLMTLVSSIYYLPSTIIFVGYINNTSNNNTFGGTGFSYYWTKLQGAGTDTYSDPGECSTSGTVITANTAFDMMLIIPSSSASATSTYVDNVLATNGSCSGTYAAGQTVDRLGYNSFNAGNNFKGAFGEILVYNKAISGSDRANLYTYIKNKWGTP